MPLAGTLPQDADQTKFAGLADAEGTLGYAQRGSNAADNLADQNVVLFDAHGQPLLVAANPGVVALVPGTVVAIDQGTPGVSNRVAAVQQGAWAVRPVDDGGATLGTVANPTHVLPATTAPWAVMQVDPAGQQMGTPTNPLHVRQAPVTTKQFLKLVATTTAQQLAPADPARRALRIVNTGSRRVWLGPAGVTALTGVPLDAGQWHDDRDSTDAWHVLSDTQTCEVRAYAVVSA